MLKTTVSDPNLQPASTDIPSAFENQREVLRKAALASDQIKSTVEQVDSLEGNTLWTGIVDGQWSVIDLFNSNGRRYYVAHRNDPQSNRFQSLTPRQQQVVMHAAMGEADKYIAYELGLSKPTVASYLASAKVKLGVSSRMELIRLVIDMNKEKQVLDDTSQKCV